MTVLATGRSARPIVGRIVGPRNKAAAPTATPVSALPLNMSSIRAILVSVRGLPAAPADAAASDKHPEPHTSQPLSRFFNMKPAAQLQPLRDEQNLADMAARLHEAMRLGRLDQRKPLIGEHA